MQLSKSEIEGLAEAGESHRFLNHEQITTLADLQLTDDDEITVVQNPIGVTVTFGGDTAWVMVDDGRMCEVDDLG